MPKYLFSAHSAEGESRPAVTEQDMREFMQRLNQFEDEMRAKHAWVFSGKLHGPDTATVVRLKNGEILTTDGPFVETKEHLAGFYIIEAKDLDDALAWARKAAEVLRIPIEVRPFADTKS